MKQSWILCIEDDPEVAGLIVEVLEEEKFRVSVAASGSAALAAIRQQPDLVLCDIDLPDLSGFEVLEHLRQETLAPATMPFIFVTAFSHRAHQLRARALGCDDFIAKPIDFEMLVPIVRHRLTLARQRQPAPADFRLTDRELEILTWVARGKSSSNIASIVGVTDRTVNFHIDNIIRKTGAATRVQAAVKCGILGIIRP